MSSLSLPPKQEVKSEIRKGKTCDPVVYLASSSLCSQVLSISAILLSFSLRSLCNSVEIKAF